MCGVQFHICPLTAIRSGAFDRSGRIPMEVIFIRILAIQENDYITDSRIGELNIVVAYKLLGQYRQETHIIRKMVGAI